MVIAACGIVSIFSLLRHRAIVAIILYYPDQQSQDKLGSLVEAFKSLQTISALKRSKASSSTTSSTTFTIPSQNAQFLQFLLRIIPGHIDPNPHCAMGDSEPTLLADVQHYKEHYKDTWYHLALLRGFQGSRFPGFLTVSLAFSRCHPTISIQKISLEHIRTPAI